VLTNSNCTLQLDAAALIYSAAVIAVAILPIKFQDCRVARSRLQLSLQRKQLLLFHDTVIDFYSLLPDFEESSSALPPMIAWYFAIFESWLLIWRTFR